MSPKAIPLPFHSAAATTAQSAGPAALGLGNEKPFGGFGGGNDAAWGEIKLHYAVGGGVPEWPMNENER